jgi:hypothetical protein
MLHIVHNKLIWYAMVKGTELSKLVLKLKDGK